MVNKEKRFETIYTQGTSWSIVIDNETGVNYLVHDTSITPLLNKDGSIVTTDVNKMYFSFSVIFSFLAKFQVLQCTFLIFHVF